MTFEANDCYSFMWLTHILAVCWGFPYTRRKINDNSEHSRDSIVQGNESYIYIYTLI